MVCQTISSIVLSCKFFYLEPEVSPNQVEKDESVVNHDGWLNALSLDKLTTTVCQRNQTLKSIRFVLSFKGMKVVSGSLDVLETVGKKTFDVCSKAFFIE